MGGWHHRLDGHEFEQTVSNSEGHGITEDEMGGWPRQLDGHEFEQSLSNSEGQGSLVCCSPWGFTELDTTE